MIERKNKNFRAGAVITGFMLLIILVGMVWTPYDPNAMNTAAKMAATLIAIALSTVLNAIYYIPAIVTVWSLPESELPKRAPRDIAFSVSAVISIVIVVFLGIAYTPVMRLIETGLALM